MLGTVRQTLLPLVLVLGAACASDAGDFEPGPVCHAAIMHGELEEIIPVGVQRQFDFIYMPCDFNDQAPRTEVWKTSDAGVATVTSTGLVTGRNVGTARITASVEGGAAYRDIQVIAPQ